LEDSSKIWKPSVLKTIHADTLPPPEPTAAELLAQTARYTLGTCLFLVAIVLQQMANAVARAGERIGGD
jgi:hypothetical protein